MQEHQTPDRLVCPFTCLPSFLAKNRLVREGPGSVAPVVIPALAPTLDRTLKEDRSLCPVRALRYYLTDKGVTPSVLTFQFSGQVMSWDIHEKMRDTFACSTL